MNEHMMAQECQSLQLRVVAFRGQLNNTVWARLTVLAGWASVVQSCQKQTCSLFENCLGLMARVCCCSATPGSCLFPINYLQCNSPYPSSGLSGMLDAGDAGHILSSNVCFESIEINIQLSIGYFLVYRYGVEQTVPLKHTVMLQNYFFSG